MHHTLDKLFAEQLADLLDAERQLIQALPMMATAAKSPELRRAFETHLTQTQEHHRRVGQLLSRMGNPPTKHCKGMEGLIAEGP
jgi:ferritin-like metal-binding protein YciE